MKRINQVVVYATAFFFLIIIHFNCKKADHSSVNYKTSSTTVDPSKMGSSAYCTNCKTSGAANSRSGKRSASAKVVTENSTIYNTDYLSFGVGGMRDVGSGVITVDGLSGTVSKAILFWHGVTNSTTDVGKVIMVNSTSVAGENIGISSSNCWPYTYSQAYKADVTALIQSTRNGSYNLTDFGDLNPNGASLIIFYSDGNSTNNRDVVIFAGNDSNVEFGGITDNANAPYDPGGWFVSLSGINYTLGPANIQLHVSDGQEFPDAALLLNSETLVPAGANFDGNSVPSANNGPTNTGSLWDIKTYDISSYLAAGPNTVALESPVALGDCLGLVVALIDLPAGAAPVNEVVVHLDIKPGGCPNPFNLTEKGKIPAAIIGTGTFDVGQIDPSSLKLNGIAPLSWQYGDAGAPYTDDVSGCSSCSDAPPDGIQDLILMFDNAALTSSLGEVADGECLALTITGNLKTEFEGTQVVGKDYVTILKKGKTQ